MSEQAKMCDLCGKNPLERQCPCGKNVCDECSDFGVYTDEDCCKTCAAELRQSWRDCPAHDFDEPEENEDGQLIEQCKKCDYPHLAGSAS